MLHWSIVLVVYCLFAVQLALVHWKYHKALQTIDRIRKELIELRDGILANKDR